MLFIN